MVANSAGANGRQIVRSGVRLKRSHWVTVGEGVKKNRRKRESQIKAVAVERQC